MSAQKEIFATFPPLRKAVIIGWNGAPPTSCQGGVNDAKLLAALFKCVYGFQVVLLTDENNEQENMLEVKRRLCDRGNLDKAMEWLVSGAKVGDSLVICYCGVGARWGRLNDGKEDDMDEHILLFHPKEQITGSKSPPTNPIDMKRFWEYLQRVPAGVTVTFFMDCAHGSSVADVDGWLPEGADVKIISAQRQGQKPAYICAKEGCSSRIQTRKADPKPDSRERRDPARAREMRLRPRGAGAQVVKPGVNLFVWAACRPHENAYEILSPNGKWHGVWTLAFVNTVLQQRRMIARTASVFQAAADEADRILSWALKNSGKADEIIWGAPGTGGEGRLVGQKSEKLGEEGVIQLVPRKRTRQTPVMKYNDIANSDGVKECSPFNRCFLLPYTAYKKKPVPVPLGGGAGAAEREGVEETVAVADVTGYPMNFTGQSTELQFSDFQKPYDAPITSFQYQHNQPVIVLNPSNFPPHRLRRAADYAFAEDERMMRFLRQEAAWQYALHSVHREALQGGEHNKGSISKEKAGTKKTAGDGRMVGRGSEPLTSEAARHSSFLQERAQKYADTLDDSFGVGEGSKTRSKALQDISLAAPLTRIQNIEQIRQKREDAVERFRREKWKLENIPKTLRTALQAPRGEPPKRTTNTQETNQPASVHRAAATPPNAAARNHTAPAPHPSSVHVYQLPPAPWYHPPAVPLDPAQYAQQVHSGQAHTAQPMQPSYPHVPVQIPYTYTAGPSPYPTADATPYTYAQAPLTEGHAVPQVGYPAQAVVAPQVLQSSVAAYPLPSGYPAASWGAAGGVSGPN
uniref:Peptidase C14 caspase domain-containing protein n=1 Tax=Chromera velia CCMP2878 TaxID=1169474 RepID=A0A0G4FLB1_9ALVE|eukprot:Cvel_17450.t1-p1 / transcript=Cvel_17450.t1 / gene=Cvel_17450 / organism=Chromera_velia_CCMP2878 / gene_product=Metacaspase-1, putative / transcript_product=Metacaspase-1, putative / location=Cvel_scaffold1393:2849-7014(-) / protein_length=801 / sequence_SO=supercontig / SO=protein_coding / is_pseudo=false